MLNKQKGNMYGFVTHTWNPIKGKCSHDCGYCYMKVWKQNPIRLVEKELQDNLGEGNFIFIGSSTDMFANDVPKDWIWRVLIHTHRYPNNKYLFQTKNPLRFGEFFMSFPENSVFGTTIETNRDMVGNAPLTRDRKEFMKLMRTYKTMITIEPIMNFDLDIMLSWMASIRPNWVNIGADSKGHNLPEPSKEKTLALIEELKKFTEVKIKPNLKRIIG